MNFYQRLSDETTSRCTNAGWIAKPCEFRHLPVPPKLSNTDVSEDLFQRLAVAYGLSFSEFDIGDIQPPEAIPDMEAQGARTPKDYISKDHV